MLLGVRAGVAGVLVSVALGVTGVDAGVDGVVVGVDAGVGAGVGVSGACVGSGVAGSGVGSDVASGVWELAGNGVVAALDTGGIGVSVGVIAADGIIVTVKGDSWVGSPCATVGAANWVIAGVMFGSEQAACTSRMSGVTEVHTLIAFHITGVISSS